MDMEAELAVADAALLELNSVRARLQKSLAQLDREEDDLARMAADIEAAIVKVKAMEVSHV